MLVFCNFLLNVMIFYPDLSSIIKYFKINWLPERKMSLFLLRIFLKSKTGCVLVVAYYCLAFKKNCKAIVLWGFQNSWLLVSMYIHKLWRWNVSWLEFMKIHEFFFIPDYFRLSFQILYMGENIVFTLLHSFCSHPNLDVGLKDL